MRKKQDNNASFGTNRSKYQATTSRTSHQQRRHFNTPIIKPRTMEISRSFSSPMSKATVENLDLVQMSNLGRADNILRSFSTPEPRGKPDRGDDSDEYLKTSNQPTFRGTRIGDTDSDSEQYEAYEDAPLLDVDANMDQAIFGSYRKSPEHEMSPPKRVVASLLPGSGLQKVSIKPTMKSHNANLRDVTKQNLLERQKFFSGTDEGDGKEKQTPGKQHQATTRQFRLKPLSVPCSGDELLGASPDLDTLGLKPLECELSKPELPGRTTMMAIEESDDEQIPEFGSLNGSVGASHTSAGADVATIMENLKKSSLGTRQNQLNQSSINQTQVTSSSSQQMVSSTTTSSSSQRVQTASARLQHMSASDLKASSMKSDLSELKSSISEMKNLSQRLRSSMENIVDKDDMSERKITDIHDMGDMGDMSDMGDMGDMGEPLVTFPESDTPPPGGEGKQQLLPASTKANTSGEMKYEAARVTSALRTRVSGAGFAEQRSAANSARVRRVQAGDVSYSEQSAAGARRHRVHADGVTAEQSDAYLQEQRSLKAGDVSAQEANNVAASSVKLQTDSFCSEQKAMASQQARQTVTSSGMFSQEKHMAQSNMTIMSKGMCTKSSIMSSQLSQLMNGSIKPGDEDLSNITFEDLDRLSSSSNQKDIDQAIEKYSSRMDAFIRYLKNAPGDIALKNASANLNKLNEIMRRAWAVPTYGHELGYSLCNTLRNSGGLDLLMANCIDDNEDLQFSSAKLLEQCLTTENRAHVVENGLDKVVNVACVCKKNINSVDHSRVRTGILEHLFKHSEGTCSDVIRLGGLDAVLFECRKNDVETLRHCAGALANLSLYGGAENQEAMIKRKVPMWLFPLAFHTDDNIKYYACLAIAVLVANKEIEAAVLKSGTLDLVEPFVTTHNPSEFARSNLAHAHGQSKNWLKRLVPVLSSKREEARNLAAFHFCMEAGIKKQQGNTEIFASIGAIEPLKIVASCPNAVASKYAAQALRLIGEEVPHKLSQQVPLWSTEDVREWVKQIGFAECANNFVESRVDGDLLLQLTEENLMEDIGLTNGIRRRRFTRELQNLKKMADYSSRDTGNLNDFLQNIGAEYSIYTYSMLNAGVDKISIRGLTENQLENECGIRNSIHRLRIMEMIRAKENTLSNMSEESKDKPLDVFVSYRRSNGSQLASLLKVHLEIRGYTVFIDVERLEAGKFDNNLLQSIRKARNFLLVLTPKALDRCVADTEQKDWVHKEIVAALQSQCNIIPIIDNFQWPEPEELPEDMRQICHFNGVRWIHDYQDACVDKLERFMRAVELNMRADGSPFGRLCKGDATPSTPSTAQIGRGPPSYQRMLSSDSAKGSDKDATSTSSRD